MEGKSIFKQKTLVASAVMMAVVMVLFIVAYFQISALIENRCLQRMEEGVNTATEEIVSKLQRDSEILNATAEILAGVEELEPQTLAETMNTITPLLETMTVRIMLPDGRIIRDDGFVLDGSQTFDFKELAKKGEHISDRNVSLEDGETMILRHYVPIKRDGKIQALLYGVTTLKELPEIMNISNIYNASASVYIIDQRTGEFIMDTWHGEVGDLNGFEPVGIKHDSSWEETKEEIVSGEKGYTILRPSENDGWMYFYYAPAGINQWSVAVSVPEDVAEVAFVNVNDGTVEGLKYKKKPIYTVQFHPEACAGPKDSEVLFERFMNMMESKED